MAPTGQGPAFLPPRGDASRFPMGMLSAAAIPDAVSTMGWTLPCSIWKTYVEWVLIRRETGVCETALLILASRIRSAKPRTLDHRALTCPISYCTYQ